MIPKLRSYQTNTIETASRILTKKNSVLIVAPTGSGKTIIAAEIMRRLEANGFHAAFLAHRTELIDQSVEKLQRFGVIPGVLMADDPRYYPFAKIQVCSVPTLGRRLKYVGTVEGKLRQGPPKANVLIYDEAHHSLANTNRKVIEYYQKVHRAKIIGLTATPFRSDGIGLSDVYEDQVLACRPEELMASGALVNYEAFAYESPDLRGVRMTAGDYDEKDLHEAITKATTRVGNIVREYVDHAAGRRAILFPVDIADSKKLCEAFEIAGFKAAHVDWSTPKDQRRAALEAFDRGEVQILASVGVLTEGFDSPRAEVCILGRPTASLTLHLQMIGRVLRPVPCACGADYAPTPACVCGRPWEKTQALIHDHSGNLLRHGLPDDPDRDYSMHATSQRVRAMNTCPACKQVFTALKDRKCPHCGEILAAPDTTGMAASGGGEKEIVELESTERISKDEIRARRQTEFADKLRGHLTDEQRARANSAGADVRKREYARLLKLRDEKGYKANFASIRYMATFGEWPRWKEAEMVGVSPAEEPFFPLAPPRTPLEAYEAQQNLTEPPPDAPLPDAPPPWMEID